MMCQFWGHPVYIAVKRDHFFENDSGKPVNLGQTYFYRETSVQAACSQANVCRIVSPTSRRPTSFEFEHKTWIDVVMNYFGTELRNFSDKGLFTPLFRTLPVFVLQPWPLGLGRI